MFKSIETLTFNHDFVEIVLNESKSNLKQLEINVASNDGCSHDYQYRNLAAKLGRKISQFKNQVNKQVAIDVKVLKYVELVVDGPLIESLGILQEIQTSKLCLELCKNELELMVNVYLENQFIQSFN